MSLMVAAADAEVSAALIGQLNEIEAGVIACRDLVAVLECCGNAPELDCIICAHFDWVTRIVDANPQLSVVLATNQTVDGELALGALRAGLADVWAMPMPSGFLQERLRSIRTQAAARTVAERKLRSYVQELERDQRAGRYIQTGMLPPSPTTIGAYRFEYRVVPSLMMSGDFVDYFPLDDQHFLFYIADVSGHGASSAFITVLLKELSRRVRREHTAAMLREPGRFLEWINAELLERKFDKYVAVILGVGNMGTNEIALVNGGHYPPALRSGAAGTELVPQKGKPVGLFATVGYEARVLKMLPGDRLVMFSDGVLDAVGPGSLADKEARLLAAAGAGADLAEVWAGLAIAGPELRRPDDMACLVVQRER